MDKNLPDEVPLSPGDTKSSVGAASGSVIAPGSPVPTSAPEQLTNAPVSTPQAAVVAASPPVQPIASPAPNQPPVPAAQQLQPATAPVPQLVQAPVPPSPSEQAPASPATSTPSPVPSAFMPAAKNEPAPAVPPPVPTSTGGKTAATSAPQISAVSSQLNIPAKPHVIGEQIPIDPAELTKSKPVSGQFGASTTTIHIVRRALVGILIFLLLLGVYMLFQSGQLKEWWFNLVVNPIRGMSQP